MAYVINDACINELDGSCVDMCPVDCIYEGLTKRYINPNECIDCGNCLSECPVSAIQSPKDITDPTWQQDNAVFFALPLPGREEALGDPGGAVGLGAVGVDTPLAASWIKE
ncbi:indolepyruvate ferredoxin oxidoreductase subunit alpha [Nocardia sp. CA-119907]|uniref:indolepyruvate ferredoxin oxidoreductase subunit alpha n=1 Tax=Nocardia sp. CA-119907 TaxID=3239973 RepID=UPI003D95D436